MSKQEIVESFYKNKCTIGEVVYVYDKEQQKSIKTEGVIYTPWSIVERIINLSQLHCTQSIVEPSCGHGIFIFGLLEHAKNSWGLKGQDLYNWFINHVTGIEISANVVEELSEILTIYFKKEGIEQVYFSNLICSDGLLIKKQFDVCIGNPPYVRTKNLDVEYLKQLRENFISCQSGNIDLYYAFIEHYTLICKKVVFITPNSFLTNTSAKNLLNLIKERLNYVWDFREKLMFPDARTYTCIFKIENKTDSFLLNDKEIKKDIYFSDKLQKKSSKVLSGIATLADKVYIVEKKGEKYYANNFEIEATIVVPLIKITKQKDNNLDGIKYIIYPYNNKKVIPEDVLQTQYPLTYTYLLSQKDRLNQRDKGKTSGYEAWYAYGRKQGLHSISNNLITIIPQMLGSQCKPIILNIEELLKKFPIILFTSGFVVPLQDDKYLSSEFITYAINQGKPWPGKEQSYYSLTSTQVAAYSS